MIHGSRRGPGTGATGGRAATATAKDVFKEVPARLWEENERREDQVVLASDELFPYSVFLSLSVVSFSRF